MTRCELIFRFPFAENETVRPPPLKSVALVEMTAEGEITVVGAGATTEYWKFGPNELITG